MKLYPSFPPSTNDLPSKSFDRIKVCIATPDYLYLVKNGGIGTSFHHTACTLAEFNFDITILFCNFTDHLTPCHIDSAKDKLKQLGIHLETLFPDSFGAADLREFNPSDAECVSSYAAYHHLKRKNFDLIIFPDWRGLGYYTLQAKRMGIAFQQTAIWVQAHSTCLWHALSNEQPSFTELDTRIFQMERKSVAMADVVVSPTHYLLDWKEQHGFNLPKDSYVQPLLLTGLLGEHPASRKNVTKIKEIVFFGRLEKRKGLHIFVQAIKRMIREYYGNKLPSYLTITFLGKITEIDGKNSYDYLAENLGDLGPQMRVLSSLGSTSAIAYLKAEGRMAVIPSVTDNSPLTVLECIHNEIPFIAAATGGIPEIISPDDHDAVLFKLGVRSLSDKLRSILVNGVSTAFPAVRQQESNIPAWLDAIRASVEEQRIKNQMDVSNESDNDLISVCVTHFNRPKYLKVTLDGLLAQTYKNFEVIIVDDGSTTVEAKEYLEDLETATLPFPVTIIRQKNEFVGAARNKARERAQGKYIVFMDDDNFAHPDQLRIFLSSIVHSKYDALTCVAVAFSEEQDPRALASFLHLYIPLGSGLATNLFQNHYGDANGIFRADFLKALGGFTEDEGLSWEDYELLFKVEISGGKVGVVPEPLMYLRSTVGSVSRRGSNLANYYRALRPALSALPWSTFGDAILVALNGAFARNSPITSEEQNKRSVTEKHLTRSVEFSGANLRWLVRRMAERKEDEAVIATLMGHYQASPVFSFNLIECFCFCLKQGLAFPKILERMGNDAAQKATVLALGNVFLGKDTRSLHHFLVETAPAIGQSLDGQLLLAKINMILGNIVDALLMLESIFADVEASYLRQNDDIRQIVMDIDENSRLNTEPIQSGLHHWLLYGQFEGRSLGYSRPLSVPYALYDHEIPHDYTDRIKRAETLSIQERGSVYSQLLYECLECNCPLALVALATVILRDANLTYLEQYEDVNHYGDGEFVRRGIMHYHTYGRNEDRDSILRVIESRKYDTIPAQWHSANKRLLRTRTSGGHSIQSSFAGSLG